MVGESLNRFLHSLADHSNKNKSMSNEEIRARIHLNVPPNEKELYLQLIYRYKQVISTSKANLGRSKTYHYRIQLKDKKPFINLSSLSNRIARLSLRALWRIGSN